MFPHSKQHCYPTCSSCCCDVGKLAEIERIVDFKTHKQLFEWTGIELLFFANRAVSPRSQMGGLHMYIYLNKGACQTPPPRAPPKVDPQHV